MSDEIIIHSNEVAKKFELEVLVHNSVVEMLNSLLKQEVQSLTNAAKNERTEDWQGSQADRESTDWFRGCEAEDFQTERRAFETAILNNEVNCNYV